LRDILRADDPQILAARDMITNVAPDLLLLTNFDFDLKLHALHALADMLRQQGLDYPHTFAFPPNSGMPSDLDLNGDGLFGTRQDVHGFGEFAGQGGMALLSRHPLDHTNAQDFSRMLWRDLPGAISPVGMSKMQRLSSVGH
jgi:hypothetical protein